MGKGVKCKLKSEGGFGNFREEGLFLPNGVKIFTKSLRGSFDIANGLEKLRNLRHCSRNNFSNENEYKFVKLSRLQ